MLKRKVSSELANTRSFSGKRVDGLADCVLVMFLCNLRCTLAVKMVVDKLKNAAIDSKSVAGPVKRLV